MKLQGEDAKPDHQPGSSSTRAAASPGLAHWRSVIEGQKVLAQKDVASMQAQAHFADASRMSMRLSIERYGRNRLMTRVTRDVSRLIYGYLVVYLEARGGITLTAIRELCAEIGLASRGRAQTILFHMRAIGFVKPDPTGSDRRSRRYVASQEMRDNLREVVTDELRAFSLIEPDAGIAAGRLAEPDFFRVFMIRFGEGIVAGLKSRPQRVITHFAEPNAGLVILWDILSSAQEGDSYPPRGLLRMSVSELAQKYDVSRSHVFRLLRDAEALGFLKRNADEQTGTIEDVLADDVAELHATSFMGLALCCECAFQSTDALRAAGE